jgi:23S rRNA pseudouridine1911/1915/1917 synthase
VLHEDALLLAVAKPRGLPTMPGGGLYLEHTLLAVVRRRAPEASPMHRLGRDTSGVVLFARTTAAARVVQAAFRGRQVRKVYRALCGGHPALDAFSIDAPIGEVPHALLGTIHAAAADGQPSRSHVRVLERRDGGGAPCALVEVEIETGRPHQIRIHLAHAGHPLAGDPLFGPGGLPLPGTRALPGDPGYLLHAMRLELDHPADRRRLVVECAPPPVLREGGLPAAGPSDAHR